MGSVRLIMSRAVLDEGRRDGPMAETVKCAKCYSTKVPGTKCVGCGDES